MFREKGRACTDPLRPSPTQLREEIGKREGVREEGEGGSERREGGRE